MVAGLEMPTSGRIEIGGRNVTYLRPRYRNVGMVFQDYGLYRHMTVFGNIAYPLQVRSLPKADIRSKVEAVASTMQISDILARKPDQLSAGQLQRVAIARMLVRDADIFLMDEPMSHLDAQLRGQMRAELRHIQKDIGVTTIFVTHDQLEAMTMADRIIVMKDGEMLQYAPPQEIFERPSSEFVATFVGEPQMNVFDCVLRKGAGGIQAEIEGRPFRSTPHGQRQTHLRNASIRSSGSAFARSTSGLPLRQKTAYLLLRNSIPSSRREPRISMSSSSGPVS